MNTQPEALRLADEIMKTQDARILFESAYDAALELRRLHALNTELVEALKLTDSVLLWVKVNANVVQRDVQVVIAKAEGMEQ